MSHALQANPSQALMPYLIVCSLLALLFLLLELPAEAKKLDVKSETARVTISGYIQTQFQVTNEEDEIPSNSFGIRRGHLQLESELTDALRTVFEVNAATDGVAARDVYLRYKLSPAFSIKAGQVKKPFCFSQLQAPRKASMIERPLYTRRIFEEYLGRDVGLLIDWEPLKQLELNVGVFNGAVDEVSPAQDSNSAKDFVGRAELELVKGLQLAVNASCHALSEEGFATTDVRRVRAYGADMTFRRSGFQIVGEGLFGDRPRIDGDDKMVGWSITMTHKRELPALGITAEYGGRVEYMDGDSTDDNDAVTAVTPYIGAYFHPDARLQFCPVIQFPQDEEAILEYTLQAQIEF